ncbi:hypothetical protein HQ36_03250 [Porphyromonas gingivicanis]|uniref:Uncharacterized protein n=1 Tax=Porphyromonas gingivicanis TaxID=266762 RepID=A0A0A2G3W0_9PORP|nr:hypothetical protein HQ36_03250 [Porphyromonas gingivicanis]
MLLSVKCIGILHQGLKQLFLLTTPCISQNNSYLCHEQFREGLFTVDGFVKLATTRKNAKTFSLTEESNAHAFSIIQKALFLNRCS